MCVLGQKANENTAAYSTFTFIYTKLKPCMIVSKGKADIQPRFKQTKCHL